MQQSTPRPAGRFRPTRIMAAVGAVLAVLVGGVATAVPAAAAPPHWSCPSGNHCLFYADFEGYRYAMFTSDRTFWDNYWPNGQTVANNSWAASNSTTGSYESHYWDSTGYVGFLFCINPGTGRDIPLNLRDRAESMSLRGTTSIRCL